MQKPAKPANEAARLGRLRGLNILDTLPEERFDRLTRLARRLFDVPIALVSLVDENRQWFKSAQGLDVTETSRDISFCGHTILGDGIMAIPDASLDERFHDNPLVMAEPNIRFYAGCPLILPDGNKLGTLCIIDSEARELCDYDKKLLSDLAGMAEQELAAIQLATIDELTGLSNRRGFETLSVYALELCRRVKKPISLMFFDLDNFKQINDQFGHAEGDQALNDFAHMLKNTYRNSDVLGRIGGDEFAVLLTAASEENLDTTLSRLQQAVDLYNTGSNNGYDIDYSVGAVEFDAICHNDIYELMAEADALMYEQKIYKLKHTDMAAGNSG